MLSQAIIFIPGATGTQLEDQNTFGHDILWRDKRYNVNPIENLHLTQNYGTGYFDSKIDTLIAPGSLEWLVYGGIIRRLHNKIDKPVYLFNYDWRMPNKQTGKKLHQFIDMLKKKSIAAKKDNTNPKVKIEEIKKVDIIIHSQGNHVLRHYINDQGFGCINKAIFVAPPFLGSLEMVQAMLCGQGMWWSKEETRKIVRTFPGSFELLPNYKCAAQKNKKPIDFYNYKDWQQSYGVVDGKAKFTKLLKAAKTANDAIHTGWLSKLTQAEKDNILVIIKDGYDTMQKVDVADSEQWINEVNFGNPANTNIHGDKIVPHVSSTVYAGTLRTIMVKQAPWVDDKTHAFILTSGRVKRLITRFLEGRSLAMPGKHIEEVTTPYKVTCNE